MPKLQDNIYYNNFLLFSTEMFHSQIKCIIVRYLKAIMKYTPQAHTYENTHAHIYIYMYIQIGAQALCLNLKQTEVHMKFLYLIMNKKKY